MNLYDALFITITIVLSAFIGRDASRRDMSVRSWVFLTLLFSVLILPVYLYLKKPAAPVIPSQPV